MKQILRSLKKYLNRLIDFFKNLQSSTRVSSITDSISANHKNIDMVFSNGFTITIKTPSSKQTKSLLKKHLIKLEGAFDLYFELIKINLTEELSKEFSYELAYIAAKAWRDSNVHFRENFEELYYELDLNDT
ncbi:11355_t:CDS:1 [Funneliformis geosporum]|uniref:5354_t:CDS:1 n=1 Tax=Funneliformis geosporum TaxID=1117311 RepID=A0A9W4SYG7_9GLOM|nr:5354_t:CDS:1 [Funneliformis geosporum]CAI2185741.1 11355_t:CDS:1 [Funneliformis geosporum]